MICVYIQVELLQHLSLSLNICLSMSGLLLSTWDMVWQLVIGYPGECCYVLYHLPFLFLLL